eukprot:TRINITY_DN10871_c1_g1_i1.p1 TRINITY_DN10871_c1_g1~~TRINITY_DN10871_c1_g1_i1.p1  ORF type:complete len:330 (+),score=54.89 TRINITY_DN10871_c1_g1_i1:82-1071(+)
MAAMSEAFKVLGAGQISPRRSRALGVCLLGGLAAAVASHIHWLGNAQLEGEATSASSMPEAPDASALAVFLESYRTSLYSWVAGLAIAIISSKLCFLQKDSKLYEEPPPFEKRADFDRLVWVNAWLSVMSGMVNAVAFLDMKMTVSHMTGNVTYGGIRLPKAEMRLQGLNYFCLIVSFMVGSAVLGASNADAEAPYMRRFSPALTATAFAVAGAFVIRHFEGDAMVTLELLAFSQGIMNALTRKCQSMPLCVSHVTGYATDAGFMLGDWATAIGSGREWPCLKKIAIFVITIGSFALGGFAVVYFHETYRLHMLLVSAAGILLTASGIC